VLALEAAKAEAKSAAFISKIKKIISQGKQAHDEVKHFAAKGLKLCNQKLLRH
jgi:hypothetical protein